jgi:hypothetical protein
MIIKRIIFTVSTGVALTNEAQYHRFRIEVHKGEKMPIL